MAGPPTKDQVFALLRGVVDPELGSDIVELGMAKSVTISDTGEIDINIDLTIEGCPLQGQIRKDVVTRVESSPGVTSVKIHWGVLSQEEKSATMAVARKNAAERSAVTAIAPTTKVITVASGKGGVGKSSVTVNLAVGLATRGFTVGVIDADIGGFSLPRMFGITGRLSGTKVAGADASPTDAGAGADSHEDNDQAAPSDDLAGIHDRTSESGELSDNEASSDGESTAGAPSPQMVPLERRYGDGLVRLVSMGFLTDTEETALPWRGATLGRAVQHFLEDVRWGHLDYLVIDTPPGTGDIQMGLARMLPRAEVIVVTTPALAAQKVSSRAVDLARKHFLRVVGVVENMSAFVCEHGETYALFGEGGGQDLADSAGIPLLGSIPLDTEVAAGSSTGDPAILGTGVGAAALNELVDHIVNEAIPPTDLSGCSARILDAANAALDAMDAADAAAADKS